MALQLSPKAPTGVVRYTWTPPVLDGDGVLSATLVVAGGTVVLDSYGLDGQSVYFYASGGANGETATIEAEAVTQDGETLVETLYLAVRSSDNAFGYNVGDILSYALRPIVGIGRTATAAELEDARENLDDMLAELRESGGDIGIKLPTEVSDTLYISDDFISALKNGLRVRIAALYGRPLDQMTVMAAQRGLQRIKAQLLPDDRKVTFF